MLKSSAKSLNCMLCSCPRTLTLIRLSKYKNMPDESNIEKMKDHRKRARPGSRDLTYFCGRETASLSL